MISDETKAYYDLPSACLLQKTLQQLMEALSPQMVRLKLYLYQKTELLFAHQTCQ